MNLIDLVTDDSGKQEITLNGEAITPKTLFQKRRKSMTEKEWDNLKTDDVIINANGNRMIVMEWDYYGVGKPIICFAEGGWVYPQSEFSSSDWALERK